MALNALSYARRRYGVHGDDATESDMVDAAGKTAGGSFGLGRNLAGSDVAADAVDRARQADLDGEKEREEKAKAEECVGRGVGRVCSCGVAGLLSLP